MGILPDYNDDLSSLASVYSKSILPLESSMLLTKGGEARCPKFTQLDGQLLDRPGTPIYLLTAEAAILNLPSRLHPLSQI